MCTAWQTARLSYYVAHLPPRMSTCDRALDTQDEVPRSTTWQTARLADYVRHLTWLHLPVCWIFDEVPWHTARIISTGYMMHLKQTHLLVCWIHAMRSQGTQSHRLADRQTARQRQCRSRSTPRMDLLACLFDIHERPKEYSLAHSVLTMMQITSHDSPGWQTTC